MTGDPGDPGSARQRRRGVIVLAGVVLLAATASGIALYRSGDDEPTAGLTVTWGGSEGHPSCVFDPKDRTVEATLTIDGEAPPTHQVTVTVTAYADENTSKPVGSSSRTVPVNGTVHLTVTVTIPVQKAPQVDVDGETACALEVTYGTRLTQESLSTTG